MTPFLHGIIESVVNLLKILAKKISKNIHILLVFIEALLILNLNSSLWKTRKNPIESLGLWDVKKLLKACKSCCKYATLGG